MLVRTVPRPGRPRSGSPRRRQRCKEGPSRFRRAFFARSPYPLKDSLSGQNFQPPFRCRQVFHDSAEACRRSIDHRRGASSLWLGGEVGRLTPRPSTIVRGNIGTSTEKDGQEKSGMGAHDLSSLVCGARLATNHRREPEWSRYCTTSDRKLEL